MQTSSKQKMSATSIGGPGTSRVLLIRLVKEGQEVKQDDITPRIRNFNKRRDDRDKKHLLVLDVPKSPTTKEKLEEIYNQARNGLLIPVNNT